jgi:hypothetical protein
LLTSAFWTVVWRVWKNGARWQISHLVTNKLKRSMFSLEGWYHCKRP